MDFVCIRRGSPLALCGNMTRCVLVVVGALALIAAGCALPPSGTGDVSESDAGTKGPRPDSGASHGSSPEASAPDPGDDMEPDADSDDGDESDTDANDRERARSFRRLPRSDQYAPTFGGAATAFP